MTCFLAVISIFIYDVVNLPTTYFKMSPTGFILGKLGLLYLVKNEDEDGHILIVGGSGSGKTSCAIIPSIASFRGRIFCIDIKGELIKKTGKRRPCKRVFSPGKSNSFSYDVYSLLYKGKNQVEDAKDIAMSLVPKPIDIKDPFWIEGAQNLLTGAILHFVNEGYSFIDTICEIQGTPVSKLIHAISESKTVEARYFVNQFVEMDNKTLIGIYAQLSNRIMLFATSSDIKEVLTKNQRGRNITPSDLDNGFDIYSVIPEDKLEQYEPLLSLMIVQQIRHLERRSEDSRVPILFIIDEFPRLGKIEVIINALATLRSKNISFCLVIQSLAQLDTIYGNSVRKVIVDNCAYKLIYKATDPNTQEEISRMIGTKAQVRNSRNITYGGDDSSIKSTGVSEMEVDKRIVKPEELAVLEDNLILLTPKGYCKAKKTPYYRNKLFS